MGSENNRRAMFDVTTKPSPSEPPERDTMRLTTPITSAEIATAGSVPVYVKNPGGTGIYNNQPGQISNTVTFTVQ